MMITMRSARSNRRLDLSLGRLVLTAFLLPSAGFLAGALAVAAQEAISTKLVVRVVANDAKIIGSGVGGAYVVVRNAETGKVLAEGLQEGGTGNTGRIMGTRERHATVFDTEGAAAFRAEVPLSRPTVVEVEAHGPLGAPHATRRGTTTLLMIPGEDLVGEGVVVNLNGFTVELLSPAGELFEATSGEAFAVRAKVTMLCGCPTEPGGMWNSDEYDIRAQWVRDGTVVAEIPLTFAGTPSEYAGAIAAPAEPGAVTLRVLAVDRARANTGMTDRPGLIR